jgi:hypothetical protein
MRSNNYYGIRIVLILSLFGLAGIAQAAWSMKQSRLMTRWASQVDVNHPLPEYPRPQLVRQEWQNLNGLWQYQPGASDDAVPAGQTLSSQILVPFPVESAISGIMDHHEHLWYRRQFEIPAEWNGQRILLHFGAVDWESQVYVNGTSIGIHRGGYDAFSYDITDVLTGSGPQELIVRVFDPTNSQAIACGKQDLNPSGIWYTPATGIWQTVWLEPVPLDSICMLKLIPDVDFNTLRVTVDVSESARTLMVQATAYRDGKAAGTVSGTAGQELNLTLHNPRLWSPEDPYLYDLKVVLKRDDSVVDEIDSYFGMRKIELKKVDGVNRMCLNGQFVFQIGPLDQGYWPDGIYTAPTDEAMKWDLEMAKTFGFNMVRKHVKVEPARWYYWADKLGLLVWQDMPSKRSGGTAQERTQFEAELERMVKQFQSHPSIILWVVFNEGWGQYDTERITQNVMSWDSSRLVTCASGWTDYNVGHVLDYHSYPAPAAPTPTSTRASVCGEYGGIGMRVTDHMWDASSWGYTMVDNGQALADLYDSFAQQLSSFKNNPGLSAAVYTQITDVEVEINGLITYDREVIKADIEQIRVSNFLYPRTYQTILATSEKTGQSWRYTTSTPAQGWQQTDFDDSGWLTGPGGFGTAGTPGAVVKTAWNTADIWLRKTFNPGILSSEDLEKLILRIHHDEDTEIYLNGVLATSVTGYTTDYIRLDVTDAGRAALLSDQTNLIAIHCHQTYGGQYIDVGLQLEFIETPQAECGQWGYAPADFNRDCTVDLKDLSIFVLDWLNCSLPNRLDCDSFIGPSSLKYDVNVEWNDSSERVVYKPSTGGAWYPRTLILDNGTWLCAYDTNAASTTTYVQISRSTDSGMSWSYLSKPSFGIGDAANAELIQLANGTILCAYRLVNGDTKTLKVSHSNDNGSTWLHLSDITSNTDGVWEPQIIQKEDGQLLVFYAQEGNIAGTDQVIEMMRSDDNGKSWHSPQVICSTPGSRDGMPVATLLGSKDILVVLEGHDVNRNGQFVTWSVRSADGGDTWGPRTLVYAPADVNHYAVAPYITSVKNGPIFVSFHTNEDGGTVPKAGIVSSTDNGLTWTVQPKPFINNISERYYWNSLMMETSLNLVISSCASGSGPNKIKIMKSAVNRIPL